MQLRSLYARAVIALFALSLALPGAALADDGAVQAPADIPSTADSAVAVNDTPQLWFVELASPPSVEGTDPATLAAEQQAFRTAASRAGVSFTERFAFSTLWNGLSIQVAASDLAKLQRVDGVKALWPVTTVALPPVTTPQEDPDLLTALAMTGADVAQSELGLSGAGVRVGVIDTGIDYAHPDLGGCSAIGPSCRVVTGFDFVGDAYNADDPLHNTPVPDPDPQDCLTAGANGGHGTHVAGIVGANGAVKGVAPGVVFGAYRVFGCNGSTTADVIIAALERALADSMQVVNMSLGASRQWPRYPTAVASDRLVNKGVTVVAAIGNDAAQGVYAASAPGVGSKVIGVASFDNTNQNVPAFTISPDNRKVGYLSAVGAPPAPLDGTSPMKRTGTKTTPNDACSTLAAGSLTGKIALIRRGGCGFFGFFVKASNAQAAGAIGVVLYNNLTTGLVTPNVVGATPITIPVVFVTKIDGELINDRLAAGPVDLTWTAQVVSLPNPTGGKISSFSSFGLAPDLTLKPDIGAPGGFIRSTFPVVKGSYATLSGTSMSSPHVAGAAALLLEALPHTPSQAVRTILQNSADPRTSGATGFTSSLDNVHRQGAGMLKIDRAVQATTRIEPGKLSLGESESGPATRTLTLTNNDGADATYVLSHAPALSTTGSTFAPMLTTGFASVTFSQLAVPVTSVTVPAGASVGVDVTVTANPALADRSQYGGYLVFTPQAGGNPLRVPYAGFKGDYQSIQALVPTPCGFPWIAKAGGTTTCTTSPALSVSGFTKQTAGSFTMAGTDIVHVIVHLDHPVRRVRAEVFDANTGQSFHRAFDFQYVGRNSSATSFYDLPWDGITVGGNKTYTVPNGDYVIVLTIQKALGDDNNPADFETWTSPRLTIARP